MRNILLWCLGVLGISLTLPAIAGGPTTAHTLPQAKPGAPYSTQLSIPPGLGYPFSSCKLSGDALPKGLIFDCDRLQLKGRAPFGIEKTYNVTLEIQDAQGNEKSFDLTLRVSAKPEVVDLSPPELPSPAVQSVNTATTVSSAVQAQAKGSEDSPRPAAPRVAASGSARVAKHEVVLREAMARAETVSVALSPVEPRTTLLPQVVADQDQSSTNEKCIEPAIGKEISEEGTTKTKGTAQFLLKQAEDTYTTANGDANCNTAANALSDKGKSCQAYFQSLFALKDAASVTAVLLNDCSLNGKLNDVQHQWYAQRALAWQTLAQSIDEAQTKDPAQTKPTRITAPPFKLPDNIVSKLKSPISAISSDTAPVTKLRIAGFPHGGDTTVTLSFDPAPDDKSIPNISIYQLTAPLGNQSGQTADNEGCGHGHGTPLDIANAKDAKSPLSSIQPSVDVNGTASIALASPLQADTYICAASPSSKGLQSSARLVTNPFDLGRMRMYFTSGILIANNDQSVQNANGGSFSTAHAFLALTLDSAFLLPGCYLTIYANHTDTGVCQHRRFVYKGAFAPPPSDNPNSALDLRGLNGQHGGVSNTTFAPPDWWHRHSPGVSGFFESRLTAIPVSSVNTSSQSTTTTSTSGGTRSGSSFLSGSANASGTANGSGDTSGSNSTGNSSSSFLTTQKTARLDAGLYMPFLLTRWDWNGRPNSLFAAPLAKVGFDTITGAQQQAVTDQNGKPISIYLENLYKFDGFGVRIGHFSMTHTNRHSPEILSYLDITYGRYSNLESYICHPPKPGASGGTLPNSSCGADYGGSNADYIDSRKRLYRFNFEGLLQIPRTPVVLGLSANVGQEAFGAQRLDHAFQPPDDLRFLFGTKLDLSSVLSKLNLGSKAQ